jgi:hypothetical protein
VTPTPTDLVRAAVQAAQLRGCTCDLEVSLYVDDENLYHGTCRHDDWCPVLADSQ